MDWLKAAQIGLALGKTFSGGAKQQSADRSNTNVINTNRDRTAADAVHQANQDALAKAELELKQKQADDAAREAAYRQSLRSAYLQGWTPAQRPDGIQMITGGFNTIPQGAKDAAAEMQRQATMKLLNGEQLSPLPTLQSYTPSPLQGPSTLEKLSGILGLGLTGGATIANILKKQPTATDENDGL